MDAIEKLEKMIADGDVSIGYLNGDWSYFYQAKQSQMFKTLRDTVNAAYDKTNNPGGGNG